MCRSAGSDFPGDDRLVQRECLCLHEPTVGDDLVAGRQPDKVSDDQLLDVHPSRPSVSHEGRRRFDERGKPVEGALCADFLGDPDRGVRNQDAEKERVAPVRVEQCQGTEDRQDQVENGENVGADDASVGATRRERRQRPANGEAALRLGRGEADGRWSASDGRALHLHGHDGARTIRTEDAA